MSFWDDAASVAKAITTVAKPVAAGVAIVYPPAAPIAAGIFIADKALDAAQPPPKPGSSQFAAIVANAQAKAAARGQQVPTPVAARAVEVKLAKRHAAGQRVVRNTFELAAKGDRDAARGATIIVKRAAARREAKRWRIKRGRIVRVR